MLDIFLLLRISFASLVDEQGNLVEQKYTKAGLYIYCLLLHVFEKV